MWFLLSCSLDKTLGVGIKMYDDIMDETIQKYEEIIMRYNSIDEQNKKLKKDIDNFYSYLFSIQRLNALNHKE